MGDVRFIGSIKIISGFVVVGSQKHHKFRVVILSPSGSGGQPEYVNQYVTAVSETASKSNISVELVTGTDLEKRFRTTNYPIHDILPKFDTENTCRILPRVVAWYWLEFRRDSICISWLDKNKDVDAVHFQEFDHLTTNLQLWRFKNRVKKVFLTVHNIFPHKYPPIIPHFLILAYTKISWRNFDTLFVHSENLKESLTKFLGRSHPPIEVIPHGIFSPPCSVFENNLTTRLDFRKALFFGNIRANKGLHIALAAMRSLTDFELTIAGSPADSTYWYEIIMPLVSSLRHNGAKIELIPEFIPENSLCKLFAEHSFVILPYTKGFEAQSGVLHMAIALKTPLVVTNVGALGEIVSTRGIGEIANPEDPEQLAHAVRKLYQWDTNQLAYNLDVASKQLSWDEAAQVTVNSYLTQLRAGKQEP
jgi:glycosyltransferase involved in cell wall biosynthesis